MKLEKVLKLEFNVLRIAEGKFFTMVQKNNMTKKFTFCNAPVNCQFFSETFGGLLNRNIN